MDTGKCLSKSLNLQRQRRATRCRQARRNVKESVTPQDPIVGITKPDNRRKRAKFGLINIKSIRYKVIDFYEMILDNTLDLIAVTETWLSADDYVTPRGDLSSKVQCHTYTQTRWKRRRHCINL